MTTIYTFQRRLSERLLLWSVLSIAVGIVFAWRKTEPDWRAFGQQHVGWGAVDALIALIGGFNTWRQAANPSAQQPAARQRAADKLQRLLWINAGLDLFYVAGGLWLSRRADPNRRGWRGHGWAVMIQGFFLLIFDIVHASHIHRGAP